MLAAPGGIAALLDFGSRRALQVKRTIVPNNGLVAALLGTERAKSIMSLRGIVLSFFGVRAIDGVDLDVRAGKIHGLIGPNGSGKTTILNVISGYYRPEAGTIAIERRGAQGWRFRIACLAGNRENLPDAPASSGEATVLQNVMIGGDNPRRERVSPNRCSRCPPPPATKQTLRRKR